MAQSQAKKLVPGPVAVDLAIRLDECELSNLIHHDTRRAPVRERRAEPLMIRAHHRRVVIHAARFHALDRLLNIRFGHDRAADGEMALSRGRKHPLHTLYRAREAYLSENRETIL